MNNPIPPLSAIFARLFLLQGVAYKTQQQQQQQQQLQSNASTERIEWARVLCHRLRSDCPADSVDHLCGALLVDRHTAISALRRSNGDLEAAGDIVARDQNDQRSVARKYRRQQSIGRCANGIDYVDLDQVPILCGYLNFPAPSFDDNDNDNNSIAEDLERGKHNEQPPGTSTSIVFGLLRLSNNNIEKSPELYRILGAEAIFRRVEQLDGRNGKRRRRWPANDNDTKQNPTTEHPVRHIDIAILLSMGVDESRGRDALKRVGSVEEAFLWLSKHDVSSCDTNGNGEDIASSCPAIQAQDDGKIIEQEQEHDAAKCTGPDSNSKMEPVDSTSHGKQIKAKEAHDLLIAELGNAIRACSKDLEIEWLGADLEKEWSIIEKYIS
uniref:UBA domain-containing protein n=1 Tax=Pseudo-nitzschia australis TaxID=44445 RepID=A0A6U9ZZU9_9STRA